MLAGVVQRRANPDPATYLGKGKAVELRDIVIAEGADTVVCDTELAPSQRRALEDVVQVKVIDRTALILDIFAQHAKSREGKAQVELAQLQYLLPRLRGWGESMSRQAGGQAAGGQGMGSRGPGETKIELDRRRINSRIAKLRALIKEMKTVRDTKRGSRRANAVPSVAIAGYTNAGKSSILNRLTGAGVLVENQLFATLDPTVRRAETADGRMYTLTDTVGFVRSLPHQLVEAFRSTLEEVAGADLLLHVVDGSHPDPEGQISAVRAVLSDVGATDVREVIVINKADLADPEVVDRLRRHERHSVARLRAHGRRARRARGPHRRRAAPAGRRRRGARPLRPGGPREPHPRGAERSSRASTGPTGRGSRRGCAPTSPVTSRHTPSDPFGCTASPVEGPPPGTVTVVPAPLEITTNRLTLRPPTEGDRSLWLRLHRDPALYEHAPWAMPATDADATRLFEEARSRWSSVGFDYGVVEETGTRSGVGVGGLSRRAPRRRRGGAHALLPAGTEGPGSRSRHGGGEGLDRARHRVAAGVPRVLRSRPANEPSVRVALRAGLEPVGTVAEGPDGGLSTVLRAPRVESPDSLDEATRESLLDLWCAVNDAGGAVGFLPRTPRHEVAGALATHEEEMEDGVTTPVLLRGARERVVAAGFWVADRNPLLGHSRTAFRIMTDPRMRGRNLGRLLLAAMHRVAREQRVEVGLVDVRSGLGTTRFYERCGYVEVGRLPGVIRVAPGDDRDCVVMARRLDDRPLVADGRA